MGIKTNKKNYLSYLKNKKQKKIKPSGFILK